jgi:hypothetical protein
MNDEKHARERLIFAARNYTSFQLRKGASSQQIVEALIRKGLTDDEATELVQQHSQSRQQAERPLSEHPLRRAGVRNMCLGALWFLGGVGVTYFTYMNAASSPDGGYFVVATGAILTGIAQFFFGLKQFSSVNS